MQCCTLVISFNEMSYMGEYLSYDAGQGVQLMDGG